MGLVVQPPVDALLALLAGPSVEGAATPAPGEGGMFAELMATLLPDGSAGGGEGDGTEDGIGLPFAVAPEQESKTSNESALALLTAAALVQFVPQAKPAVEPVAEQAAVAAEPMDSALEALQSRVQGQAAEAPGELVQAEAAPVAAENPAEAVESAPAAEGSVLEAAEAASQPTSELPEAASQPRPATEATQSEPSSEAQNESGVVRPVGNAETSNRSQSGEDNAKSGERGVPRGPGRMENTPRASATAIENAAPNSAVGALRTESGASPLAEAPAVEAPAPVEVPPQVDQVVGTIFESVEVGATEATLRLDPAEMGEVVIRIHSDGEGLRIDIRAERPEAMQLLRDRTEELTQLLGERGLNLSDVNVGPGGGNNDQADEGARRRNGTPANGEFADILGIDEPGSASRHNRLRSAYNPDGAHLYRV